MNEPCDSAKPSQGSVRFLRSSSHESERARHMQVGDCVIVCGQCVAACVASVAATER